MALESEDYCFNRKIWTPEDTCQLIELYKEYRNLWDPEDPDYKNRMRKREALVELGHLFDVTPMEIERKLRSICAQYRRERRNSKKYQAAGSTFRPKWFGYDLMSFLHDRNKLKKDEESCSVQVASAQGSDSSGLSEDDDDVILEGGSSTKPEDMEEVSNTNENNAHHDTKGREEDNGSDITKELPLPPTINKSSRNAAARTAQHMNESQEVLSLMMADYYKLRRRDILRDTADEYDIFGELIAKKIRGLRTHYARITVQNIIHNVIYQAELGKYDSPSTTAMSPSSLAHLTNSPTSL